MDWELFSVWVLCFVDGRMEGRKGAGEGRKKNNIKVCMFILLRMLLQVKVIFLEFCRFYKLWKIFNREVERNIEKEFILSQKYLKSQ